MFYLINNIFKPSEIDGSDLRINLRNHQANRFEEQLQTTPFYFFNQMIAFKKMNNGILSSC